MAATGFLPNLVETTDAYYPEYPSIPSKTQERIGWERTDRWRKEKEDAKWSVSTYEWPWLRTKVRKATDGLVDIPLGGLIAFHIGDDGETWKVGGETITRGDKFTSTTFAKWELDDEIKDTCQSFIHGFSKQGFNTEGKLNWNLDPGFPISAGTYANECLPSGTLTTEKFGSVQMTQYNLEYELSDDTANADKPVDLAESTGLEFFGWIGGWSHDGHVYAVGAVHPRATGDYCGLDNPHLEEVLTEVRGEEVNLDLEDTLYGRVRTIMGAVR